MRYRLLFGLTTAALLAGCATPPGQLKESDFVSESNTFDAPVAVTSRNFLQGLRYCGPSTRYGVFAATNHGVAQCTLPHVDDGSITCDMYAPSAYGGRSDIVLGRVDFAPLDNGTLTTFRVRSWAGGKSDTIDAWRKFTLGAAS